MNDGMVKTLLAIAAVLVGALVVGAFTGPARGLALTAAALFCLVACRIAWLEARDGGHVPEPAEADSFRPWTRLWLRLRRKWRPGGRAARQADGSAATSCGVCVLDRDYRVLWRNASSAAHLGLRGEAAIGRPFARSRELAAYVAAGDFSKPLQLRADAPEDRVLALSLVPYLKSQWLLLSRDVTQDTRAEAVRRAGVADALHELCTPVTVLAGYLDTVSRLRLDPWRSSDYLRSMELQCRRMHSTIEDLLDLWTLESVSEPSRDQRVDVVALLATIRADIEALSGGRHRISLEAQAGLHLVGSPGEIARAFSNLASNAVRYTNAGGEVRLEWRAVPGGAEFSVEDSGIGIAAEHIPRLTERFYRVDREFSRRNGGTGLGLAIVKDVLDRHQATLVIESEPGQGSRFTARFPAHRVPGPEAAVETEGRGEASRSGATVIPFNEANGKIPARA